MIIFTGGKTAGHVYPLMEIIKYFDKEEVLYVGLKGNIEEEICKKSNISFLGINLNKVNDYLKEYKKIKKIDFDFVVSTGGFVSIPALLACRSRKKEYILLEENAVMGITNLLFRNKALYVCLAFKYKKMRKNYLYTFNPTVERKIDKLKYKTNKKRILILGGSLGSKFMREVALKLAVVKKENEEIVFVSKNYEINNPKITYYKYVDDLPSLIYSSSLVISRAGGGSICEILGMKKKAIFIPSSKTKRNHQIKNAKYLSDNNLANYILEEDFSINKLLKLSNNINNYDESLIINDSAYKISRLIKGALNE